MRADSGRHNAQQQERGVKHRSNVGETDGVWNGKGTERQRGQGVKGRSGSEVEGAESGTHQS